MRRFVKFLICLLILNTINSHFAFSACKALSGATVLFLDFNNAKAEIDTVQKKVTAQCGRLEIVTNVDNLKETLKSLEKKKAKVTDLIVSGHSSYTYFWGKNKDGKLTWLSRSSLLELIQQSPTLQENLEAVYLWGCYTGTKDAVEKWVSALPNVFVIFGHNGLAHLSGNGTGERYLENAMEMKKTIVSQATDADLMRAVDQVVPKSGSEYMVSASIWTRSCSNGRRKESFFSVDPKETHISQLEDFSKLEKVCEKRREEFEDRFQKDLTKYWMGEKEILSIDHPDGKDPEKYPLRRKMYPWINNNSNCFPKGLMVNDQSFLWLQIGDPKNITPDHILRLIYFNSIKENFHKKYEKELNSLKKDLLNEELDISELGKLASLSRKEVLDLLKKMRTVDFGKLSSTASIKLVRMSNLIENMLVELNPLCTNVTWLEPEEKVEEPASECSEAPMPNSFVK